MPTVRALLLSMILAAFGSPLGQAAATEYTNWVVTATFQEDGTKTCSLRFRVAKDTPTLVLNMRAPSKGAAPADSFTLGALPAFLAAEKTTIFKMEISIGAWHDSGIRGNWRRGADEGKSSIQFYASKRAGAVLPALSAASAMVIAFRIGPNVHSYTFDLNGLSEPLATYAQCSDTIG